MARREKHQSVECRVLRGGRRSAGEVRRQRMRRWVRLVLLRWRYWQVRRRARLSSEAGGGTLQHGLRGKGEIRDDRTTTTTIRAQRGLWGYRGALPRGPFGHRRRASCNASAAVALVLTCLCSPNPLASCCCKACLRKLRRLVRPRKWGASQPQRGTSTSCRASASKAAAPGSTWPAATACGSVARVDLRSISPP